MEMTPKMKLFMTISLQSIILSTLGEYEISMKNSVTAPVHKGDFNHRLRPNSVSMKTFWENSVTPHPQPSIKTEEESSMNTHEVCNLYSGTRSDHSPSIKEG